MRLLLAERLAGPLRTKGGERVLGVKLDGDPDFRGPATSKTRATVDTLVTSIKHGGGANYKHAMFCSLFSNGTRSFEAAGPRKSESPSFSPLVPARHLSCATDQRDAPQVTKAA